MRLAEETAVEEALVAAEELPAEEEALDSAAEEEETVSSEETEVPSEEEVPVKAEVPSEDEVEVDEVASPVVETTVSLREVEETPAEELPIFNVQEASVNKAKEEARK